MSSQRRSLDENKVSRPEASHAAGPG